MSEHSKNKIQLIFLSLLPILFLLSAETALFYSQRYLVTFIAYFSFAVLACQLLCHLVFVKGEICNGQRARLTKANLYLAIYWIGLFIMGAMAEKRYVPLALMIAAALLLLVTVWQQPKDDDGLRRAILLFGTICGVLGVLSYMAIMVNLPLQDWFRYSPFSQILLGLVLANWLLRLSRNRLQGFIALLPRLMLLTLLCNAVYCVVVLLLLHFNLILLTVSITGFVLYFAIHLLLAGFLVWVIMKNKTLDLILLSFLLLVTLSFPFLLA